MAFMSKNHKDTQSDNQADSNKGERELHEAAVKAVISQHGPFARRNPHYLELVEDAKKQIRQAVEANKTFNT